MINDRESNINVIKYKIEDFETVDEFSVKMLHANPLVGVITLGHEDDEFLIPISNLKKLDDYLKEEINTVDDVLKVIDQYESLIELVEEYMIPREELILNYDYAFVEGDTLMLPCIPTSHSYLESRTKREFYISALCAPNYKSDAERLSAFSYMHGKEDVEHIEERPNKKKEKKTEKEPKVEKTKKKTKKSVERRDPFFKRLQEKVFSGGEDDIFEFHNEESLPEGIYVVKVRSTGEEYPLMYGPDIIGTDQSSCSICFTPRQNMEAEHCSITLARGSYYLADLNSRSGTLLNGQPLDPGKTYELRSADLITVADEELVFSKRV